jgi:hypothetical protein
MNYAAILTAREQYETDEAFLAAANAEQVTWNSYFISYRKLRAMLPKAVVDAMAQIVSVADPLAHQMLLIPGNEKGDAGGVDLALPESRDMIDQMEATGVLTHEQAESVRSLSRTITRPCEEWGVSEMTQAVLDEARRRAEMADMDIAVHARVEAYYEARQTYIRDGGERPVL